MNKDQIFSIYNLSKFLCLLAYLFIALNSRADNGYWDFDSSKNLMDDMGKFVDYGKSLGYEFADIDIYYDAKSIKPIGDKKRVWFIKSGLDSGIKYFKAYAEFDCIDSITILDLTAFDSFSSANGSSVKTDGRKDYYEPESSFKNLAEEVCK